MAILIIALLAALISASRDKSYIRFLEEEIHMRDVIIRDYQNESSNSENIKNVKEAN